MRCASFLVLLAAALLAAAPGAFAHKASDAYLQLRALPGTDGATGGIEVRWDIALRDLDAAVEVDADGDARITWGEVKAAWPAIDAYALPRLAIAGCPLRPVRRGLERRSDGAYAVLWLHSPCALPADPAVDYALFAEIDPTHRGLLKIERAGAPVQLRVLDPAGRRAAAASPATGRSPPAVPSSFVGEGIGHIVGGYDHVLFLLVLLLPAAVRRDGQGGWRPVASLRQAVWPVVGIVSAFTAAHSITLALAALKVATLPPGFIEPAIAATIVAAAVDNLHPVLRLPRAAAAFLFGLVHGFGFAGVLAELDLPSGAFARALLGFNVGLELGQLAIVFAVVAVLYRLRRWRGYRRWIVGAGSSVAIAIGAAWFVERTAHVALLPF